MGIFKLNRYAWNFPSNNYGQISGIADSGVETFRGTPIKSLAREICQNSIDANLGNGKPTKVVFKTFSLTPSEVPGSADLYDAFKRSLDYWSKQKSDKAKNFFKNALRISNNKELTCLRISDFNTTGLLGSDEEYNSPWCNLTKSQGTSDKSGSFGGSFGIGKFAPYACSDYRTVFYSTLDSKGDEAYQGVSRITSFKDKNGDTTQGIGFYGETKNAPVKKQIHMDPYYQRDGISGTDIYVLGFNGDKSWKNDMVASILDGFLYSIYSGNLIVEVEDIIIDKDHLDELVSEFKPYFKENAEKYYETLVSDEKKSPVYETQIGKYGKVILRLMIKPEFHRRVAMVRKTGMKIMDKGNISTLIPFAGVLFIEGDKLNEYLRTLENPQHTKWEVQRADNQAEAKRILSELRKFIVESLDKLKKEDSEEAIDPSVGEYLADEPDSKDNKNQDNSEDINNEVKDIITKVIIHNAKSDISGENQDKKSEEEDPDGEIQTEDVPGDGSKIGDNERKHRGGGGGKGEGDGKGQNSKDHLKNFSPVSSLRSRVVCRNKDNGEYIVNFIPGSDAVDGEIRLFLSAESQSYEAKIISANSNGANLAVEDNKIKGLTFSKRIPVKISVKVDFYDFCAMEVKAYGHKI